MFSVLGIFNETRNKLTSNEENHNYFTLKIVFVLLSAMHLNSKFF